MTRPAQQDRSEPVAVHVNVVAEQADRRVAGRREPGVHAHVGRAGPPLMDLDGQHVFALDEQACIDRVNVEVSFGLATCFLVGERVECGAIGQIVSNDLDAVQIHGGPVVADQV